MKIIHFDNFCAVVTKHLIELSVRKIPNGEISLGAFKVDLSNAWLRGFALPKVTGYVRPKLAEYVTAMRAMDICDGNGTVVLDKLMEAVRSGFSGKSVQAVPLSQMVLGQRLGEFSKFLNFDVEVSSEYFESAIVPDLTAAAVDVDDGLIPESLGGKLKEVAAPVTTDVSPKG